MKEKLTAIFQKSPYGYIGFVEELPGANTQGKTLEETRKNLIEAECRDRGVKPSNFI